MDSTEFTRLTSSRVVVSEASTAVGGKSYSNDALDAILDASLNLNSLKRALDIRKCLRGSVRHEYMLASELKSFFDEHGSEYAIDVIRLEPLIVVTRDVIRATFGYGYMFDNAGRIREFELPKDTKWTVHVHSNDTQNETWATHSLEPIIVSLREK